MAKGKTRSASKESSAGARQEASKKPSFSPDRKGEASAGTLASKDKKRAVPSRRDGSNTR